MKEKLHFAGRRQSIVKKLAIYGGKAVRGKNNPLPEIFPREIPRVAYKYVKEVLDSGFTSKIQGKFEQAFAKSCGTKYAISVANCTASVHSSLAALDIGPGDEVITSPITDYGSIAGILAQNALPVFADVDLRNGNITAEDIKKVVTSHTKAIVLPHWWGLMCDMDPILKLTKQKNIPLIEDSCLTPLAIYKGRISGSMGDMGCFSFEGIKHLCTENGGMVITNSKTLADKVRKFAIKRGSEEKKNYGRVHTSFGLNYRFNSLSSAVGLAQLKVLPEQNEHRRNIGNMLNQKIKNIPGVIPLYIPKGCDHIYWLYSIFLDLSYFKANLWTISKAMNAEGLKGISPAPYYFVPDSHTYLKDRFHLYGNTDCPFNCHLLKRKIRYSVDNVPKAKKLIGKTLRWIFTDKYTKKDIDDIAVILHKVLNYYQTV